MSPFFSPPPAPGGAPKVFVAAVGEAMTRVAGEVADGLLAHGFTTERYLREVTLPTVEAGLAASGRTRADFSVSHLLLTATGRTEEEMTRAIDGTRAQIAFYGSTPAYRGVLELHGWGELGDELHALSTSRREDKWAGDERARRRRGAAHLRGRGGTGRGWRARSGAGTGRWSTGCPSTPRTRSTPRCGSPSCAELRDS